MRRDSSLSTINSGLLVLCGTPAPILHKAFVFVPIYRQPQEERWRGTGKRRERDNFLRQPSIADFSSDVAPSCRCCKGHSFSFRYTDNPKGSGEESLSQLSIAVLQYGEPSTGNREKQGEEWNNNEEEAKQERRGCLEKEGERD